MRDDFTAATIQTMRQRVSEKCSNPSCRAPTSGPSTEPNKRLNGGRAAHITAASPGGPRYNSFLDPEQRKDISNGIWLCISCAWKIDSNEQLYPVQLLLDWKSQAENLAHNEWCIPTIQHGGWNTGEELEKARSFVFAFGFLREATFWTQYRDGSVLPYDCFMKLQWLRNNYVGQNWNTRNKHWSFNPSIKSKQDYILFLLNHLVYQIQQQKWLTVVNNGNYEQRDIIFPFVNRYYPTEIENNLIQSNKSALFELLEAVDELRKQVDA
ncbi:TPA: hypothetical protein KD866_004697 [Vibrio parahaemolyticus]|nr:hypothetical protein [Vibrio parahaemolyticus]